MTRVVAGWILCCSFVTAQTHVQRERLMRSQQRAAAVPTSQWDRGQPLARSDHLGCSTTRALKPLGALGWMDRPRQSGTPSSFEAGWSLERHGLRAEPLPERAAERPVLRI
jgi:hypothetical protein